MKKEGRKSKIAIAISLYDKFDELSVLIDIIRHNWKGEYLISVCSNYPNAKEVIDEMGLDIDIFTQGDDIPLSKDFHPFRWRVNLIYRVNDCVKKSCTGAINAGAKYVMHLHTDAWPLDEGSLLDLIENLKRKDKKFAFRGMGVSRSRPDCPFGHVDDMFFVFNADFARDVRFFEYNSLEMAPHILGIHGTLSTLLLARVGWSNIYFYDNHTNQVFWDGKMHNPNYERGKPSMFDPERKFLHVRTQSFPSDYGFKIQAMYLKDYGIVKGKNITNFFRKYLVNKKELLNDIANIENEIDMKMKIKGFPFVEHSRLGRDFEQKQKYLDLNIRSKIGYMVKSYTDVFLNGVLRKRLGWRLYPDYSIWPYSRAIYYKKHLKQEDYPEGIKLWFMDVKPQNKKKVERLKNELRY